MSHKATKKKLAQTVLCLQWLHFSVALGPMDHIAMKIAQIHSKALLLCPCLLTESETIRLNSLIRVLASVVFQIYATCSTLNTIPNTVIIFLDVSVMELSLKILLITL